jgi:hypothetical protein
MSTLLLYCEGKAEPSTSMVLERMAEGRPSHGGAFCSRLGAREAFLQIALSQIVL